MRQWWMWLRRRDACASPDAHAAVAEARRAHADADALGARVDRIADALAETRARNHFGAAIERAIKGV